MLSDFSLVFFGRLRIRSENWIVVAKTIFATADKTAAWRFPAAWQKDTLTRWWSSRIGRTSLPRRRTFRNVTPPARRRSMTTVTITGNTPRTTRNTATVTTKTSATANITSSTTMLSSRRPRCRRLCRSPRRTIAAVTTTVSGIINSSVLAVAPAPFPRRLRRRRSPLLRWWLTTTVRYTRRPKRTTVTACRLIRRSPTSCRRRLIPNVTFRQSCLITRGLPSCFSTTTTTIIYRHCPTDTSKTSKTANPFPETSKCPVCLLTYLCKLYLDWFAGLSFALYGTISIMETV